MKSMLLVIAACFVACSSSKIPHAGPPLTKANYPEIIWVDISVLETETITSSATPPRSVCPNEMKHVVGEYCTEVKQGDCQAWKEPPCDSRNLPGCKFARCERFAPSKCVGSFVHKNFCIDADEYTEANDIYPKTDINYYQAQKICQGQGKRLCNEMEWNFACEGPEMYPYTTGLERPSNVCNFDVEHGLLNERGEMRNLLKPSNSLVQCVSPFGVRNMNGNADELTTRDASYGEHLNALKGGWWGAMRNRCLPSTVQHDDHFHELQIGTRCCQDTK